MDIKTRVNLMEVGTSLMFAQAYVGVADIIDFEGLGVIQNVNAPDQPDSKSIEPGARIRIEGILYEVDSISCVASDYADSDQNFQVNIYLKRV